MVPQHRVRLAGGRLSVGKDGAVDATKTAFDDVLADGFVHVFGGAIGAVDGTRLEFWQFDLLPVFEGFDGAFRCFWDDQRGGRWVGEPTKSIAPFVFFAIEGTNTNGDTH